MRETGGYPHLALVLCRQMRPRPAPEVRRAPAQIDRDIEYFARDNPDQLALRGLQLIVQAAKHALSRAAVILLNELEVYIRAFEMASMPGFEEKPAVVLKNARLDDDDVRNP